MIIIICILFTLLAIIIAGVQRAKFLKEKKKYPWPIAFHTVDIALYRIAVAPTPLSFPIYEVCLGQKPDETRTGLWRFPGGFVDPTDNSAEAAALRECREEVLGVEIDHFPKYITSMLTNDKRYRMSRDKILTSFYKIQYIFGAVKPGDDIAEVKWFTVDETTLEFVNPIHKQLFKALIEDLNPKKK